MNLAVLANDIQLIAAPTQQAWLAGQAARQAAVHRQRPDGDPRDLEQLPVRALSS